MGLGELAPLVRAALAPLSGRRCAIAALHFHDYARTEIAARLGLSERTVKREVEQILATVRDELARSAGNGCAEHGPLLVSRFAFGLARGRQKVLV